MTVRYRSLLSALNAARKAVRSTTARPAARSMPGLILLLVIAASGTAAFQAIADNQQLNAQTAWIENKLDDEWLSEALLQGCYELTAVGGGYLSTPEELTFIRRCVRDELQAIARSEGAELSHEALLLALPDISQG